jgi:hypothetical protein
MVTLFLFYLHVVAAAAIYTSRWRAGGIKEGLMGVGFVALIFTAGWPMATVLLSLVVAPEGFGIWLDRDAMSLALLTIVEAAGFYLISMRGSGRGAGPAAPAGFQGGGRSSTAESTPL